MKYDVVVAGVGGQGVLWVAATIAAAALDAGLDVKQVEEHGMAQRGGSVLAHLRLADTAIHSGLIPHGTADLLLAMEPLEALRHVDVLAPDGVLLAASDPVRNFDAYPNDADVLRAVDSIRGSRLVAAVGLARTAGSARATNLVMVGAASTLLPIPCDVIEARVRSAFAARGDAAVDANLRAFRAGRETASRATV